MFGISPLLLGAALSVVAAVAVSPAMAADAPQKTVVLVHGAFADGSSWSKVIPLLEAKGLRVVAVQNPLSSLAADVDATNRIIDMAPGPVILVGHSWGGQVISQAGVNDKVKALVYVAAFAPDAGESPGGISQANPPEAFANIAPDSDGYLWVRQDKFRDSFCQDLPEDEALVMAVTQKAPLASTFGDAVSEPAWKHKPCWYQVSGQDRMIAPENQQRMSARMNARKVITLDAGHASLASRPGEVAALIDEAAKATG